MLRLEKKSRNNEIQIRYRGRDPWWTKQLFFAFTLAFMLHLSGFLLFQIPSFKINSSFKFPPIQVETPLLTTQLSVDLFPKDLNDFSWEKNRKLLESNWEGLLNTTLLSLPSHISYYKTSVEHIEETQLPKWNSPLPIPIEWPFIELVIEGELRSYSLIDFDPLLKISSDHPLKESPLFVTFEVKGDNKKGEIFYYTKTQSSGVEKIDKLAEKIILSLRFDFKGPHSIIPGRLQFAIFRAKEINTDD